MSLLLKSKYLFQFMTEKSRWNYFDPSACFGYLTTAAKTEETVALPSGEAADCISKIVTAVS